MLWGWALLLLVLLSAAPTGAQAGTRVVGSAFDPSTVSVTVAPNKRDDSVWVKKLRWNGPADDAPDLSPRLFLIAPAAIARPAPASALAILLAGVILRRVVLRMPPRWQPARAPPLG